MKAEKAELRAFLKGQKLKNLKKLKKVKKLNAVCGGFWELEGSVGLDVSVGSIGEKWDVCDRWDAEDEVWMGERCIEGFQIFRFSGFQIGTGEADAMGPQVSGRGKPPKGGTTYPGA